MSDHKIPFSMPMIVRFGDLDALGHVNNAVYLTYIEAARLAYCATLAITNPARPDLMLARVEADYLRPVLMNQDVRVTSSVTRIGNKSLIMQHDVIADGSVAAKLETVLVWYDHDAQTSLAVPDDVRNKILEFEKV
jgi:acyl-CoA thioester hydrolase